MLNRLVDVLLLRPRRPLTEVWFGPGGFLSWLDACEGSDLLADDDLAVAEA